MREKETRIIEYCDVCEREAKTYSKCAICKKEYCILCGGVNGNVYNQEICRDCIGREDVQKILREDLRRWYQDKKNQIVRLRKLPKSLPNN